MREGTEWYKTRGHEGERKPSWSSQVFPGRVWTGSGRGEGEVRWNLLIWPGQKRMEREAAGRAKWPNERVAGEQKRWEDSRRKAGEEKDEKRYFVVKR